MCSLKSILIIRLSAMGDVILTTPLLRILKTQLPGVQIDFLVKQKYVSLIKTNPNIHHVFAFRSISGLIEYRDFIRKLRSTRYDVLVDLQVSLRSRLLSLFIKNRKTIRYKPARWKRFLLVHLHRDMYKDSQPVSLRYIDSVCPLGVKDDGRGAELFMDVKAASVVMKRLAGLGLVQTDKVVVMAPGAGRATKRWPEKFYAEVGNFFNNKGFRVILAGGMDDRRVCTSIADAMDTFPWNFAGEFSLQETAGLLTVSDLIISNDTGLMHMGAAFGKRIVALFGPTTCHLGFTPFRTLSTVVERALSCRPCSYHGTDKCPKGHFRCMNEISSKDVIRAAENLLTRG